MMKTWAEREVELACKRENPDRKEGEFDYGCACYESALKAYKSLMEDGHSGFSIGLTRHILDRLIDGKVLTPIEDTPDIWDFGHIRERDGAEAYQCKRMSALFKHVYPDGSVDYSDIDRFYCVNKSNPDVSYGSGLVTRVMDEIYPITMPYMPPTRNIKVVCEDFLVDPENGDYDTMGLLYCVMPDGERADVNRFFKEHDGSMTEITEEEYLDRKKLAKERGMNDEK